MQAVWKCDSCRMGSLAGLGALRDLIDDARDVAKHVDKIHP